MVITTIFRFLCFGLVQVLLAMFVALNKHQMQLFLWPSAPALQIETWLVMLMALALGVLAGAGLFWVRVLALKAQIWRLNREKKHHQHPDEQMPANTIPARSSSGRSSPDRTAQDSAPLLS
jgi:uncharacterized integral membrane protein